MNIISSNNFVVPWFLILFDLTQMVYLLFKIPYSLFIPTEISTEQIDMMKYLYWGLKKYNTNFALHTVLKLAKYQFCMTTQKKNLTWNHNN